MSFFLSRSARSCRGTWRVGLQWSPTPAPVRRGSACCSWTGSGSTCWLLGLLDGGVVLQQPGLGFAWRRPCRQRRRRPWRGWRCDSQLASKAFGLVLGGVLQLVVRGAVDVEATGGHGSGSSVEGESTKSKRTPAALVCDSQACSAKSLRCQGGKAGRRQENQGPNFGQCQLVRVRQRGVDLRPRPPRRPRLLRRRPVRRRDSQRSRRQGSATLLRVMTMLRRPGRGRNRGGSESQVLRPMMTVLAQGDRHEASPCPAGRATAVAFWRAMAPSRDGASWAASNRVTWVRRPPVP